MSSSLNGSMRRKTSRNRKESENSRKSSVKSTVVNPRKINLIEKEESATGKVGWDVYIKYFKGIGVTMGLASILFNIFNQGFAVLSNFWLSRWSEDAEAATDSSVLNLYIGIYAALGVGQALTLFGTSIVLAYGCLAAAKVLHEKLLHHTFKLPMSFFGKFCC